MDGRWKAHLTSSHPPRELGGWLLTCQPTLQASTSGCGKSWTNWVPWPINNWPRPRHGRRHHMTRQQPAASLRPDVKCCLYRPQRAVCRWCDSFAELVRSPKKLPCQIDAASTIQNQFWKKKSCRSVFFYCGQWINIRRHLPPDTYTAGPTCWTSFPEACSKNCQGGRPDNLWHPPDISRSLSSHNSQGSCATDILAG